jgi:putative methyltransferase (TIGR04325 family)
MVQRSALSPEQDFVSAVTEVFPSFAAARAACGTGYDDTDVADVIAYKTSLAFDRRQIAPEQALNSIIALGICAAETTDRPLRVLDFGGGCGFHYFRVSQVVRTPLHWAITETPTMAQRAAKLANGRFDVFATIEEASKALGEIDLVHASSAIQYVPDPLETLKYLAALRARFFALIRFPVWNAPRLVGLQRSRLSGNGIGPMPPHIADRDVAYPVTFLNFDEITRILSQYEIVLSMVAPSSNYEFRGQLVPGASLIFRSKAI